MSNISFLLFCSWLEVQACWLDGTLCHWRRLPPTDGGNFKWNSWFRFAVPSGSCEYCSSNYFKMFSFLKMRNDCLLWLLVNFLREILFQHPRVRYAACNAVGQMATDFAPGFQKKFHEKASSRVVGGKKSGKIMSPWETCCLKKEYFFFRW